jgi:transcriptional regulator with XRE-family HTH domain
MDKEIPSMSEASTAEKKETPPADLPLSVLLFKAAMDQEIALSKFAEQLNIGALSLRQFISGQTQRPRSRTLEVLAEALGMSVDEVRHRSSLRPISAPSFSEWLKERMNNADSSFSRARLTRETRISDGALRNYLSGQTLPDADQAQRLARIFDVDSLELAQVLVADQTVRAGGETIPAPEEETDEEDDVLAVGAGQMYGEDAGPESMLEDGVSPVFGATGSINSLNPDEERLLLLWRQMHPQGRRATMTYIASLLVEG